MPKIILLFDNQYLTKHISHYLFKPKVGNMRNSFALAKVFGYPEKWVFVMSEAAQLNSKFSSMRRLTGSTWGSGSETGIPRSYETLEKESAAPSLSTWELNTRRGWNGLLEGMGMGQKRGALSTQSSYFQLHLWVICCDCCWPKLMLSGF